MSLKPVMALLLCASVSAAAEPIDIACHWGKPTGKTLGAAGAVAKLFAQPADPLFLRLDLAANTVSNNDPNYSQAGMLPKLRVSVSGNSVTITASSVNLKELGGIDSLLQISVDRYSLESELLFLMAESLGASPVSQWTRPGKCVLKQF